MNNPTDKFYHVFTAGVYPQGEITEKDLQEIANNYSPTYHDAPMTTDHKREGEAFGWVDKVKAEGNKLFVKFRTISDEAIKLVRDGKYKRPSIEIADYEGKGKYLRAVSLVNFPQVKGLPDFAFNDEKGHPTIYFSEDISKDIPDFNKEDFKTEIIKDNKTIMKSNAITFADKYFNITFSEKTEYEEAFDKVIPKVEAMAEKLKNKESEIVELERKFAEAETKLGEVQKQKVNTLVNQAFSDGKILPAQKADYVDMATKDYEFTEKVIKNLPVNPAMKKNIVNNSNSTDGFDTSDKKYFNEQGKRYTYKELLKPENKEVLGLYSEDEQLELRDKYRNSNA